MAKTDFFVFTKKTAFMQRIADLVRSGHKRYNMGTISIEKAAHLANKLSQMYEPNLPRLIASRRREKGEATSRLLWWYDENRPEILTWVLLVTDGKLMFDGEKWKDPLEPKQRIHLTGYELVRITKPTEPKPVWTWRYDKKRLQDLRHEFVTAIRTRHDHDLERLIRMLWASPGFAGIREQVKAVGVLVKTEWKRVRTESETMPEIPKHLGYVQRLADKGVNLSKLKSGGLKS